MRVLKSYLKTHLLAHKIGERLLESYGSVHLVSEELSAVVTLYRLALLVTERYGERSECGGIVITSPPRLEDSSA